MNKRIMLLFILLALAGVVVSACASASATEQSGFSVLPVGDAGRGSSLFTQTINGAPACSTCHTLDGSTVVGPSLQGYGQVAGTRVEGQAAGDYTLTSITRPAAHIVEGFANAMYAQYARALDDQQLADLIAYVLGQ